MEGYSSSSFVFLCLLFLQYGSLSEGQPSDSSQDLAGPCRRWLFPCLGGDWRCTTEQSYQQFRLGPQPGCPISPTTNPPPAGECREIDGICQFTNSTLECATWVPDCDYRYTCGTVQQRNNNTNNCGNFSQGPPSPDELCLPINNTCQWYNPCFEWQSHCQGPYNCGNSDQYYSFIYGPQPLCTTYPPGRTKPIPPGDCVVQNGVCNWSNCTAYLGWCNYNWYCTSEYDKEVYYASPPPPCPPPPQNYTPPAQPGICLYNTDLGRCNFDARIIDPCAAVDCIDDYSCIVDSSTGNARCVPIIYDDCEENNGGCNSDEVCIQETPTTTACQDTPNVPCSMVGITNNGGCPQNTRCLFQNKTRQMSCVQSCYLNNGGCDEDQACINTVSAECNGYNEGVSCSTTVQCVALDELPKRCPVGQVWHPCDECGYTCYDVLTSTRSPVSNRADTGCCRGCYCPTGLVEYRERCVDPRECYSLLTDPPKPNPLPLDANEILLMMTIGNQLTTEEFENVLQFEFIDGVERVLQRIGYREVMVTLFAVYRSDGNLRVVIQLDGERISVDTSGTIASLLSANSDTFSLQVTQVNTLSTQVIPTPAEVSESGLSLSARIGIGVGVGVLCLMIVVVLGILIALVYGRNKVTMRVNNTTVGTGTSSEDAVASNVAYSKLDSDKNSITSSTCEERKEDLSIKSHENDYVI